MKRTATLLTAFALALFLSLPGQAQLRTPFSKSSNIGSDIEKVIGDYPNHFSSISGELLTRNPQSADYACTFTPDGAEECVITQYSAANKVVASWKALLLTTESFEEARKKYKALFSQLNNKAVTLNGRSYRLKGIYEAPSTEMKFTSIILTLSPEDGQASRLKVEITLYTQLLEWKVGLMVYDREREDNERGRITEQ